MEQCFAQVEAIAHQIAIAATGQAPDIDIQGLTATQVAIPSPSDGESDEVEETAIAAAATTGSNHDSDDFELVEMPPMTPDEGMCAVTIHWPGEPMSMFMTPSFLGDCLQVLESMPL